MDNVSKYLVEDLLGRGIDTYFGVSGGPIMYMFDAVMRTEGVNLIESKHETAAIFEAIGYYKATGKVPVVLVTAGPGVTNCLTGLASAKALRVPLLLVCGDVSWEKNDHILLQRGGPEGIDIEQTFAAHAEQVMRMKDPSTVSQHIVDFLRTRQGNAPSVIVLPLFISSTTMEKPIINETIAIKQFNFVTQDTIAEVNRLIDSSVRPLLVIGYGARDYADKVRQLTQHLGIPYVTTPQGKSIVSELDDMSLRHCGLAASKWIRSYLKEKPDVVLVLGTDLDDCAVGITEFISDEVNAETKLIHVDLNPKVFNRKYKTTLGIVTDIGYFVDLMLAEPSKPIREDLVSQIKETEPYAVKDFWKDQSVPITPHRALADLESSGLDARFVTDIGEHMLFCLHYLTPLKHKDFSIDLGLGSMGSGICSSIGMCLGDRQPTIVVCGDGGMQMHGMEILTAIQHNLPMVFAVFNDARYNMAHHGFRFNFGRQETFGQTNYIDFVKWAESLGIRGHLIEKPGEINQGLILGAFRSNKPVILDIRINRDIKLAGAGRVEVLKTMGEN